MTFGEWAQRVAFVAALLDQDGPEPSEDPNNNRLRLKGGRDGMKVAGVLVGDLATTTKAAVEQIADELWRQYRDDSERTNGEIAVPSRATLLAMALAEAVRRGLMVNGDGKAVTRPEGRSDPGDPRRHPRPRLHRRQTADPRIRHRVGV
jgi:hypothetical protein